MSFLKKAVAIALLLAVTIIPAKTTFASGRTPIINSPTVTVAQMKRWASSKKANANFIDLAQTFYDESVRRGVDPAVTYAQSAKETNFMHYTGVVNASYKNPCGLKITQGGGDYDILAHKKFSSWSEGIAAQVDHLALYAGQKGYPRANTPDPRHFPSIKGTAPYVENLGSKWAPGPAYGTEVVTIMKQIQSQPGGPAAKPVPKPAPAPQLAAGSEEKVKIPLSRLFGKNRYETANKINNIVKPSSSIAVVADGRLYADAMIGANLAERVGGHLYIARPEFVNADVMQGIQKGSIKKVYVMGSESSFSDKILRQMSINGVSVERVSDSNRFKLATKVANQYDSTTAILVNGSQFADSISISPLAAKEGLPLYMTNGTALDRDTAAALKGKKKVILVGGSEAISNTIENELIGSNVHVQRVAGSNRYETSFEIAKFFYPKSTQVVFATGNDFADALTGSALAKKLNSPVLLVRKDALTKSQKSYLSSLALKSAYTLGGNTVLSDKVVNDINNTIN